MHYALVNSKIYIETDAIQSLLYENILYIY